MYIKSANIDRQYRVFTNSEEVRIMSKKRSKLEIYLDVLEKINEGISRSTNIMYKCNLSWRPLREILGTLMNRGLIKEVEQHNYRCYIITEKGRETLIYFRRIVKAFNPRGNSWASSKNWREIKTFLSIVQDSWTKPFYIQYLLLQHLGLQVP